MSQICALARGRYIARLDADDIALADRLERQVMHLDRHPETAVVGGAYVVLHEDDTLGRTVHFPASDRAIRRAMLRYNPIPHPAATFRREAFERVGGFRFHEFGQDYDLWLRLAESHGVANLRRPVIYRREHSGQLTHERLAEQVTAMLVVAAAARERQAGSPDPLERVGPTPDWEQLHAQLGLSQARRRAAFERAEAGRIVALGTALPDDAAPGLQVGVALRAAATAPGLRNLWKAVRASLQHPVLVGRELIDRVAGAR